MTFAQRAVKAVRIVFLLAILVWAITAYAKYRLAKENVECEEWGAGNQVSAAPMARAKARMECVQNHAGIVEKLYYHPTFDMMNSLPNAPCKYVGVWTRTAPGNVFKYVLDDAGNFTATQMDGRDTGQSRYIGSWGYWKGNLVWFTEGHETWPMDADPIQTEDADHFTLRELDGSQSQFTRLDSVESKLCGTTGVRPDPLFVAENTDAATPSTENASADESVDTTKLLPQRRHAPPLADLAGQYVTSAPLEGDLASELKLTADGHIVGQLRCGAGSEGGNTSETGTLQVLDDWYALGAVSVNANDTCRLPARFYPLAWGGQQYLLPDTALTYLVNQLNAGHPVDTRHLLKRDSGGGQPPAWPTDKVPALPSPYAEGLLKTPLQASMTGFGNVGATSRAQLLLSSNAHDVEYGTNASIDIGTRVGVFEGMQFYAHAAPDTLHVVVTKTLLDSASVRLTWHGDWRPGDKVAVSTHP